MAWTAGLLGWVRQPGKRKREPGRRGLRPRVEAVEPRLLLSHGVEPVTQPLLHRPAKLLSALMTATPDGNLWAVLDSLPAGKSVIDRIAPEGTVSSYPVPDNQLISGITAGPDGNAWFAASYGIPPSGVGALAGKITPAGQISEFPLPARASGDADTSGEIVTGSDGNLWFTDWVVTPQRDSNALARVTPKGVITLFPLPPAPGLALAPFALNSLAAGPDGNLWFTGEPVDSFVGRMTPSGAATLFPLNRNPAGWVTDGLRGTLELSVGYRPALLGQVTVGGHISDSTIPPRDQAFFLGAFASPPVASNDSLWFVANGKIGRLRADGQFTQYSLSSFIRSPHNQADTVALAPNGTIDFLDWSTARVFRIVPQQLDASRPAHPGRPGH